MDDIRDRYLGDAPITGEDDVVQYEGLAAGETVDEDGVIHGTARVIETKVLQSPMIAANGDRLPQVAATAGNFIDMLEDGQFSADIHNQLREITTAMDDIAQFNGGKSKGKLTITIDITKEDSVFKLAASYKAAKPELPRPKSVLWTDERNNFTRFPPGQNQLFGLQPARKASQG